MPRSDAVIIHRLHLGYRYTWEIEFRVPKDCQHCEALIDEPLLHYLLDCPVLNRIRPPQFQDLPDTPVEEKYQLAAQCTKIMLECEDTFKTISLYPPLR